MVNPDTGPRQSGTPVDAAGRFAEDPTKNVRELVVEAIHRQDDLREFEEKLTTAHRVGLTRWIETELDAIKREFNLIESRRQEQKTDTKVAVDAALSAAKDAVKEQAATSEKATLKAENAAGKQSDQNTVTFNTQMNNFTSRLDDVKERVGRLEAIKQGGDDNRSNSRLDLGALIGVGGFVIAIAVAVAAFMKA